MAVLQPVRNRNLHGCKEQTAERYVPLKLGKLNAEEPKLAEVEAGNIGLMRPLGTPDALPHDESRDGVKRCVRGEVDWSDRTPSIVRQEADGGANGNRGKNRSLRKGLPPGIVLGAKESEESGKAVGSHQQQRPNQHKIVRDGHLNRLPLCSKKNLPNHNGSRQGDRQGIDGCKAES